MVKCPWCDSTAKATGKEWSYSVFSVKQYKCESCNRTVAEYYVDGKISHVIPKPPNTRQKVIAYLRMHNVATPEDLSKELKLDVEEVLNVLSELEKEGDLEWL